MKILLIAAVFASLAAAALAAPTPCPAGLRQAATAEVYFRQGDADAASWLDFVRRQINPRFPNGLIASDVFGPEGAPAGGLARQPSKALVVVLTGAPEEMQGLSEVRDAYRDRFEKGATLLVWQRSCVGF